MQQAIALGETARYQSPPNPWVGCIIVKDDKIVGLGCTQSPGHAHAEICALQVAQEKAQGATMYVSLEPCSHFGRTPPCVRSIVQAGISKIFIAQEDPDPRVRGKGIAYLQEHNIEVVIGLGKQEAYTSLSPYLYQRQHEIPYTILKAAISMDGRIATETGTSKWITSPEARQDAHLLRANSQAIVIGAGTAIHDLPKLTARYPDLTLPQQPLRVIIDTRGRVPAEGPLFDPQLAPTLVLTTEHTPASKLNEWQKAGAEVAILPLFNQSVNLHEAWKYLGKRGVLQILVEGGATLQTSLMKASLINQLTLYVGPLLLGSKGIPFFTDIIPNFDEAPQFALMKVKQIENCVRLDYSPLPKRLAT